MSEFGVNKQRQQSGKLATRRRRSAWKKKLKKQERDRERDRKKLLAHKGTRL